MTTFYTKTFSLPNKETQEWLNTDNYFNSYCHIYYDPVLSAAGTTGKSIAYNPFDEDNLDDSGLIDPRIIANSSPDVVYDKNAGSVTVEKAGDYWVCFNNVFKCASSSESVVFKIKKNGSDIYESTGIKVFHEFSGTDVTGTSATCNMIVTLAAGDIITVFADAQGSVNISSQIGSSLTVLKLHGVYGNLLYTADSNAQTQAGNIDAFGTDEGGTIVSKENAVTRTNSAGRYAPDVTRMFVYFSTFMAEVGTATDDISIKLCVTGSSTGLDEIDIGMTAGTDPVSTSYGILKEVKDNQNANIKRTDVTSSPVAFTYKKGSSWSFYDISNSGSLPSSFICGTLEDPSDAFTNDASTAVSIYKASNYDSGADFNFMDPNANADLGGNRGITLDSSTGRFTFSQPGDYLIISFLGIQEVSAAFGANHRVFLNSLTSGLFNSSPSSFVFLEGASTNFDPINNAVVSILKVEDPATDYLEPQIFGLKGKVAKGTAIVIVRLGPRLAARPGDKQYFDGGTLQFDSSVYSGQQVGQPIVKTDDTIDSADKGDQRNRRTEQSPFRMTVNGPLTLRGRARSSLPFNVAAGKRGGKK
jgi:hypothetical protein